MSFAWSDVVLIWIGVYALLSSVPRAETDDGSAVLVWVGGAATALYLLVVAATWLARTWLVEP